MTVPDSDSVEVVSSGGGKIIERPAVKRTKLSIYFLALSAKTIQGLGVEVKVPRGYLKEPY